MKKYIFTLCLLLELFAIRSLAQQRDAKPFVSNDIFQTDYFIVNNGQFGNLSADKQPTKFAIDNNGDHIYFGKNGLEWHLSKIVPMEADELNETTHSKLNEEEREEEREEEENENRKIIEKIVSMQWLNTNPNCVIECEGKSNHYFTYGEAKYSSYGYKKIVYKNLYPNIDIEYIIPKSGGIKYSLIIHEGADINDVKYRYSGDDVSVSIEGNQLHIKNLICDLVENEPVVNYVEFA